MFYPVRLGFDISPAYYTIRNVDIFLDNFNYIWTNSSLALVAVLFGWLMNKANSIFAKAWTGFVWLLFLPNTFYILTDISHLLEQWPKVNNLFKFILTIQYSIFSIFGVISFTVSIYFFQKLLDGKRKKIKLSTLILICLLNFLVGFAVVMGAIRRTNSWHVFTDPARVTRDVIALMNSQELLMLSAGFGILASLIYFFIGKTIIAWGKNFFKQ